MKNRFKSERGVMTAYVTMAVVTFVLILSAVLSGAVSIRKNQVKTLIKIKEVYEQSNEKVAEINEQRKQKEIPLITKLKSIQTETVVAQDELGNQVVVPGGFRISADSGKNIKEGIVIEDEEENQFVWIPVSNTDGNAGNRVKISENTTLEITLGRYDFSNSQNGIPHLAQNGLEYSKTTIKNMDNNYRIGNYCELNDYRESNYSEETGAQNATAKSLENFVKSVQENRGYYIARYEASYGSGISTVDWKPLSKLSKECNNLMMNYVEGTLWNFINQGDAARVSRNMYSESKFVESDLMNSYALDTAIIYIQQMGNINYANKTDGNMVLRNTGKTEDEVCKIYDLSGNMAEWTTEYHISYDEKTPSSCRGGSYDTTRSTSERTYDSTVAEHSDVSFRPILYIK